MQNLSKFFQVILFLTVLLLSSCDSDSSGSTSPEIDTEDPTVSFNDISDGENVSGVFNVSINAYDNEEIEKITLYMDDEVIDHSYSSQYEFSVNCNDYLDGNHKLTAKAWDTSGNFSAKNIEINTTYDFAPYSDGQIKVTITHYKEIDPVDSYGYGDPYFIYEIRIDDEVYDTYTSQVWEDTYEINSEVSHTFNIPDDTREYQLVVYVRDKDTSGYDQLDYTHLSGSALIWTLKPDFSLTHDFTKTYNGEEDGSSNFDDDDCEITLKVKMID